MRTVQWGDNRLDALGLASDGGYGLLIASSNATTGPSIGLEQQYAGILAPATVGVTATSAPVNSVDAYLATVPSGAPGSTGTAQAQTGANPSSTTSLPPQFAQYAELLQEQVKAPASAESKPADVPKAEPTAEQKKFAEWYKGLDAQGKANADKWFATVAKNEEAKKVGAVAPAPQTYTVVAGDNLTKIGKQFGIPWKQIFDANKDKIKDPNLIRTGQVFTIPGKEGPPPAAPEPATTKPTAAAPGAPSTSSKLSKEERLVEIKKADASIKDLTDKANQWQMEIYQGGLSDADVGRKRDSIAETLAYIAELRNYRNSLAIQLGADAPPDPNNAVYSGLGIK